MQYRQLGRTGLTVSRLGFGAMRLPMTGKGKEARVDRQKAIPLMHRAFEAGVNYVDTAVGYCNDDGQRAVGEALKAWRGKIVVSTKNPYYGDSESQWWQNLQNSLERLGVGSIDIYNHHGINWNRYVKDVEPHMGKWMTKARDQGLIKHIACSFHDNNEGLKKLIGTGYAESITLQYNLLDRQLEEGIALAHEKGLGVVVMGPVGGGRLGVRSEVMEKLVPGIERVPELALRFVLANPNVTVALSGMETAEHVEDNARIAAENVALSQADTDAIQEHLKRLRSMANLYCTGCKYCLPCPKEVAIARIFERYNVGRVYGLWDAARRQYAQIGANEWDSGAKADACIECGACEEKCPQKLPIRKQLKEAHAALTEKK